MGGGDFGEGGVEVGDDGAGGEEGFEFGVEPVFDVFGVDFGVAVGEVDGCAGAVAAECGFDGGVAATDDEEIFLEVGVRVLEVVGDVGEVFAGDVEEVGAFGAAGGEDEAFGGVGECFAEELAGDGFFRAEEEGVVGGALDVGDAGVGVDLEIELGDDGAEVGEVFFAGGFFLEGGGEGDAGDGDAVVAAEPAGAGGPPLHGGTDLCGIDVEVIEVGLFEGDGHFEAEGAGADEEDVGGFVHVGIVAGNDE